MLTVAAAVLIAIISLSLLLFTYYRVDSTTLLVQAGPFFWRVPLDQIRAITPSRSFRSSPALSFNRLKNRLRSISFSLSLTQKQSLLY